VDGRKGLEAVGFCALGALLVGGLLMLLVMTMVWIDNVEELADLVLEMGGFGLYIVEMGV
jgi:hypothetical protein